MAKQDTLLTYKTKFKRGEKVKWKRGDSIRSVMYVDKLRSGLCTVINENGAIETAYEFELESEIERQRHATDNTSSPNKSNTTARRSA